MFHFKKMLSVSFTFVLAVVFSDYALAIEDESINEDESVQVEEQDDYSQYAGENEEEDQSYGHQEVAIETAASESQTAQENEEAEEVEEEKKEEKKTISDVLSFKGDFRFRMDTVKLNDNEEVDFRHRQRIRARFGAYAALPQGFEVGLMLASGSSDSPISANQTLTNAFTSKPIWIDLAYASWKSNPEIGLGAIIGKMRNPFVRVGGNQLIFDGDIGLEGTAIGFKKKIGVVEPIINTAAMYIQERSAQKDSWLLAVQGGLKLNFENSAYIQAGISYYDFTKIKDQAILHDNLGGNTGVLSDPDDDTSAVVYANDYNLLEGHLEINGNIGKLPWGVYGTVVGNTSAEDDNIGWLIGASLGKVKDPFDVALLYNYRQIQADAVVSALTDSSFRGGGTDGKGHVWSLDFQLAKPLTLGMYYFFNKRPIEDSEDYHRWYFDLVLKY